MYKIEDIKIIPYVRFQTPDGALHDTMDKALAHTSPRHVTYKMWKPDRESGIVPAGLDSCVFLFLSDMDSVQDFERDMYKEDFCVDGIEEPGWYTWNPTLFEWEVMSDDVRILLEYLKSEE